MIDHPQFEYYNKRKLDWNNEKDLSLIGEFFGAEQEGTANGMYVNTVSWQK